MISIASSSIRPLFRSSAFWSLIVLGLVHVVSIAFTLTTVDPHEAHAECVKCFVCECSPFSKSDMLFALSLGYLQLVNVFALVLSIFSLLRRSRPLARRLRSASYVESACAIASALVYAQSFRFESSPTAETFHLIATGVTILIATFMALIIVLGGALQLARVILRIAKKKS